MAKIIRKKVNSIFVLFLLLVSWVFIGLLAKSISHDSSALVIKDVQASCCPCAPACAGSSEGSESASAESEAESGGGGCDASEMGCGELIS